MRKSEYMLSIFDRCADRKKEDWDRKKKDKVKTIEKMI